MNANQIVNSMINLEATGKLDPDELRVIRDARLRLQAALQYQVTDPETRKLVHDPVRIKAAMDHAKEVVESWGHKLA